MGVANELSRRKFMQTAIWGLGGLIGIGYIVPAAAYVIGLSLKDQHTKTWIRLGPTSETPTYEADILPIFQKSYTMCHSALGGWDVTSYQAVMTTGDHAPVVITGDSANSILTQKFLGTSPFGGIMPPGGKLPDATIQIILDWITAGAPEK